MSYQVSLNGKIFIKSKNTDYCLGVIAGLRSLCENGKLTDDKETCKNIIKASPNLENFYNEHCFLRSDELLNREEIDSISFKVLNNRTGIRVKGNGVYHLYTYNTNSFLRGLLDTIYTKDDQYLSYILPIIYSKNKTYVIVASQLSFTSGTFLEFLDTVFQVEKPPKEYELGDSTRRNGEIIMERVDRDWDN